MTHTSYYLRQHIAVSLLRLARRIGRWGAVSYHPFSQLDVDRSFRNNVDAWTPDLPDKREMP